MSPPCQTFPLWGVSWEIEDEEKEEEEEEKFLRELLTTDICFMSEMVYLSVIMLRNAICLIKICIKEHENVLWVFSRSICILILCCVRYIFISSNKDKITPISSPRSVCGSQYLV